MTIEELFSLRERVVGLQRRINADDLKLLYDLLPLIDDSIIRNQREAFEEVKQ